LFLLPTGWVPLAVAAGIILGSLVSYVRAELGLGRVFVRVVNAWHAVGPALVLGLAGEGPPSLKQWPLYTAALGAQFVFDFASAAAREWAVLGVPPRIQLRAMTLVYLIDFGLAPIGLAVAFAAQGNVAGVLLALPLVVLLRVFSRERKVRIDHELELRDAYRGTAFLLGDVIEADDAYTGTHSRDVVTLTLAVADELGLTARERRDAEFAALLHDVGKVRVPNEIINKPGPLTDEERKVIEQHTIEGERMPARRDRSDRPRLPRALGRDGLPGRRRGRGDPGHRADRLLLRRVQRDDERPVVPEGAPATRSDGGADPLPGSPVRPDGRRRPDRRPGTPTRRRLSPLVTQCYKQSLVGPLMQFGLRASACAHHP